MELVFPHERIHAVDLAKGHKGLCERGLGFYGVIHSLKAIKTARDTNLQKAMWAPFPCRPGHALYAWRVFPRHAR